MRRRSRKPARAHSFAASPVLRLPLIVSLLALAAGCTPVVLPAGPPMQAADLRDDGSVAPDGQVLPLRRFVPEAPPKAVLLALHGFNDHSGNFLSDSIDGLTHGGLLVYAYDQRGFGRAPNRGYWA